MLGAGGGSGGVKLILPALRCYSSSENLLVRRCGVWVRTCACHQGNC